MISRLSPVGPPRLVTSLVRLFASPDEVDGVLGDLMEEFSTNLLDFGEQ